MKNILIAVPTIEYIESATFKSIYDLVVPDGYTTSFETFRGYGIDHIRNVIVKHTVTHGFDYLFFVDSDILLPSNALEKLLAHERAVVSGIYVKKWPGVKLPEVFVDGERLTQWHGETIKVSASGLGCTLINTEIFRRIPDPPFVYTFSKWPHLVVSEDIDFCKKVAAFGESVWVDTSVRCGHIGKTVYTS